MVAVAVGVGVVFTVKVAVGDVDMVLLYNF